METALDKAINEYDTLKNKNNCIPKRTELTTKAQKAIVQKYDNYWQFLKHEHDYKQYFAEHPRFRPSSSRNISKEQIIKEIRELYDRLGYPPRKKQYKRSATAVNKFGTWRNVLKAANIKATFSVEHKLVSKEELVYKIKVLADFLGRMPTWSEMQRSHVVPSAVIYSFFDSYKDLADYIGYSDYHSFRKRKTKKTNKND